MASNHTEHFSLNQWQADDQVLRTDFNEDNAKIDSALKDLAAAQAEKPTRRPWTLWPQRWRKRLPRRRWRPSVKSWHPCPVW